MTLRTSTAPEVRAALLDGREGEPDVLVADSFAWHAEAQRRASGYSERLAGALCRLVARRVREGRPPCTGRQATETFQRTLHRHLLCLRGDLRLALSDEALADVADGQAEAYEARLDADWEQPGVRAPGGIPLLDPAGLERAADAEHRLRACVAACEGIPTGLLRSGVLARLYEAMTDAEKEVGDAG